MKKLWLLLAFVLLSVFALVMCSACNAFSLSDYSLSCEGGDASINASSQAVSTQPDAATLSSKCLRIHIRANSDSDADQAVKLKVRDAVTDYLSSLLDACTTKSDALALITSHSSILHDIAQRTLNANGFTYSNTVSVENSHFPDRTYDGYLFPSGNYDALIIRLGKGEGQNWWCVAFPPLCFVPDGDYTLPSSPQSSGSNGSSNGNSNSGASGSGNGSNGGNQTDATSNTIVYKSFTKELLQKWFGK